MTKGKKKIARYCIKCDKRFIPHGKGQKLCIKCFIKARNGRFISKELKQQK